MSSPPLITISPASIAEKDECFNLINLCYKKPEMDNPETQFKKTDRLLHALDGLEGCYEEGRVIKAVLSVDGRDKIVGCIVWEIIVNDAVCDEDATKGGGPMKSIYFGPFSVHPDFQNHGIGAKLMAEVDKIGLRNGASFVDISVVNLRTDLLPRYERLGFKEIGRGDFPAPERCSRPCFFLMMRKELKG